MSMRFIVFRHAAHEGLGNIENWLAKNQHTWVYVNLYENVSPPPAMALNYDGCILMGGPQSVNQTERYPEIKETLKAAERYLKLNRPLLGICLGAQAIAKVAGAKVEPSAFEFGFSTLQNLRNHPVNQVLPAQLEVFQWHGENFSLPQQALPLFVSEIVPNQGFLLGKALALQFHLELNQSSYKAWQDILHREGKQELLQKLPPQEIAYHKLAEQNKHLFLLLDAWLHSCFA